MIRSSQLVLYGDALPVKAGPSSLVAQLLGEQQRLSAVERFAERHERGALPERARYYEDLLPASPPGPGQQYAFRVDLDKCTGCKACVAGCHSLNGLDEAETWRTVGLLHGGTADAPVQQTVTTSCHHCIDPACMRGCPAAAYEKDPATGIVRHLDDQCIGCQYCVLMCPYDAPKFNARLGIVRKCDLCSARLGAGEAPACVQACPTSAIRIDVVDSAQVIEEAQGDAFLPGAPGPGATFPTTRYESARPQPKNLLPADFYAIAREHAHWPLVFMLVLTQLSAGAFVVHTTLARFGFGAAWSRASVLFALACGGFVMVASVSHLGRPKLAFRAILGLRTSWLSREILGFAAFSGLAGLRAAAFFAPADLAALGPRLDGAVAMLGVLAVTASVMVYVATRRPTWGPAVTALKFGLCALVLGSAAELLVGCVLAPAPDPAALRLLGQVLLLAMTAKLVVDLSALLHLGDRRHTAHKRSAILMTRELRGWTWARFALGAAGGLLLPAIGIDGAAIASSAFLLCLCGELCERYLFFTAATAPRMPGALS